jgi:FkbM family methyltransferase
MDTLVTNYLGQKLVVGTSTASSFRRYGRFDWLGLSIIERTLRRMASPVALDVGANLGNHTLVMAHYCSAVHAVEPMPVTRRKLQDNVARNRLRNVRVYDCALGERSGVAELYVGKDPNAGASTIIREAAHPGAERVAVVVRAGDELLAAAGVRRVDLVKIDVEGAEVRVLQGLQRTIERDRPLIFLEWNHASTRAEAAERGLFAGLLAGWQCLAIEDSVARSRFPASLPGRLARLSAKVFAKRVPVLGPFDPAATYNNVVLLHPDRRDLIGNIPLELKAKPREK